MAADKEATTVDEAIGVVGEAGTEVIAVDGGEVAGDGVEAQGVLGSENEEMQRYDWIRLMRGLEDAGRDIVRTANSGCAIGYGMLRKRVDASRNLEPTISLTQSWCCRNGVLLK